MRFIKPVNLENGIQNHAVLDKKPYAPLLSIAILDHVAIGQSAVQELKNNFNYIYNLTRIF